MIYPDAGHSRAGARPGHMANLLDPAVRRLHSLHPLSHEAVEEFAGIIENITVVQGNHQILDEDKHPSEALILLEGLACHYRTLDTARRQMTGLIVPGDFCDHGFLSSTPVRHSVLSLGRAVVGRVEVSRLAELGGRHPDIIVTIMRGASIEQACGRELVASLGARDALKRMAHFLCEMQSRLRAAGLVSDGGQFQLTMTQSELGEALGLSTVHVNRTLQHLRRANLVSLRQGSATIPDIAALAAIASFDGRYLESR